MPGAVLTAQVGAGAGGNMLAEPVTPTYVTWPEWAQKTVTDLVSIAKDNLTGNKKAAGPDMGVEAGVDKPRTFGAVFNRDTFILVAILIAAVVGIRYLGK